MDKAAAWLKTSLDYAFDDEHLLRQALTHRSARGENNERLEFLGDAVLELVVSICVYARASEASEGQLSRIRASLVKAQTLSAVAGALGVGEHIILGPGERKSGGHRRDSILADTLEAIFGAVYLDRGFDMAEAVIHRAYGDRLQSMVVLDDLRDPKSRLQEYLQGRALPVPDYDLQQVTGKAHQQSFEVSCAVPALDLSTTGQGTSRKDAEQEAAAEMLERIDSDGN